ncbi:uncharacterized protein [Nicotiana sylvestris]|uniref:uncharacterized protein n=1 Tax=Nicotiana sylvestris TaxID=4096 RepID=UPI00388C48AD
MDTFNENHFNLDVDLISLVLIPYLEVSIMFKIKVYITAVHQEYGCTITKRKAYLRRKRTFEIIYGDWDKSFSSIPKYMTTLKHFNPGLLLNGAIDGFVDCRPVIFIDGTHVYRKYDIKLLIAVAVDANRQIFPLAFAICANESE